MARAATAYIDVRGDFSAFRRQLGRQGKGLKRTGEGWGKDLTKGLTAAAAGAGLATGLVMVKAVTASAKFEKSLATLGAVSGASRKDLKALSTQARSLAENSVYSATKIVDAQASIARAGIRGAKVTKVLAGSMAMAKAGEMDLADASAATVNAMNLFGISAKDSMQVADGLAGAANATTAEVSDFTIALAQGGSAAKAAGLSFQETTTTLALLADIGIKGSDAGTSLKTALAQLAAPTNAQTLAAKQMGVEFFNANGEFKSLAEVSKMLKVAFEGMTKKERLAAAQRLVGTDGMRTVLALYSASDEKIRKYTAAISESGTAQEVAAKRSNNLIDKWQALRNATNNLLISVGESTSGPLGKQVDRFRVMMNSINRALNAQYLTVTGKKREIREAIDKAFGPIGRYIMESIRRADLTRKLGQFVTETLKFVASRVTENAPQIAKAFVQGFANGPILGQLIVGGLLLKKFGGFAKLRWLGRKMGLTLGTSMGTTAAAASAATMGGGLAGPPAKKGKLAKLGGALKTAGKKAPGVGLLVGAGIGLLEVSGNIAGTKDGTKKVKEAENALRRLNKVASLKEFKAGQKNVQKIRKDIDNLRKSPMPDGKGAKQLGIAIRGIDKALAGMSESMARRFGAPVARRLTQNWRYIAKEGTLSMRSLRRNATRSIQAIRNQIGIDTTFGRKVLTNNFRQMTEAIRTQMRRGVLSTRQGTRMIRDSLRDALRSMGMGAGVSADLMMGGKGTPGLDRPRRKRKQRGGTIRGGRPSGDSIPAVLERGEYVLNRKAVKRVGIRQLDRVNFGDAPRFGQARKMQRGGGAQPGMSVLANALTKRFNLRLTSTARPGAITASGNPSDHQTGAAIDVSNGSRPTPQMDAANAWLRRVFGRGGPFSPDYKGGGIKQMIYRTNAPGYGNHFDHVHVALIPSLARNPKAVAKIISGKGGMADLAGIAGAIGNQILAKVPILKRVWTTLKGGPGALANRALDITRKAAQLRLQKAAGSLGGGPGMPGMGGARLGKQQIAQIWRRANGGKGNANLMAAIAMAESTGNVGAVGNDPRGSQGYGLWQITTQSNDDIIAKFGGRKAMLTDPVANARAAAGILSRQGLSAWVTYNNGAYRQYLQQGGLVEMLQPGGQPGKKGNRKRKPEKPGKRKRKPGKRQRTIIDRALIKLRAARGPKERRKAINMVLERAKAIGISAGVRKAIAKNEQLALIAGDRADRAGTLTDSATITEALQAEMERRQAAGQPFSDAEQQAMVDRLTGRVGGNTQAQWITKQLAAQLGVRNNTIAATGQLTPRMERIARLIADARKKLEGLNKQAHLLNVNKSGLEKQLKGDGKTLEKAVGKAKGKKGKAAARDAKKSSLKKIREQIREVTKKLGTVNRLREAIKGPILEGLGNRQSALKESAQGHSDRLIELQGPGGPKKKLKTLPALGILGGQIFDGQNTLAGLSLDKIRVTADDTGTSDTGDTGGGDSGPSESDTRRADILEELLREANQRTRVSEAQYKVFREMPQFAGKYHTGGVIPGSRNAERTIIARGGEVVFTPEQMAALRGQATTNDGVMMVQSNVYLDGQLIDQRIERAARNTARRGNRVLPGNTGGY